MSDIFSGAENAGVKRKDNVRVLRWSEQSQQVTEQQNMDRLTSASDQRSDFIILLSDL